MATHYGTLVAHGNAPYKHTEGASPSYFATLAQGDRQLDLWGVDLERAISESNCEVGQEVAIESHGRQKVKVPMEIKDAAGKVVRTDYQEVEKNLWSVAPHVVENERQAEPANVEQADALEIHEGVTLKKRRETTPKATREEKQPTSSPPPSLQTLLNGQFVRNDAGEYRRVNENRVALVDAGESIKVRDKGMDAFQASIELAKAKGWQSIEIAGNPKFLAEAWFHARKAGLEVSGYEPQAKDIERLEAEQKHQGQPLAAEGKDQSDRENPIPATPSRADLAIAAVRDRLDAEERARTEAVKSTAQKVEAKGMHVGPIVLIDSQHAYQDAGRGTVKAHRLDQLSERPAAGHNVKIAYKGGVGQVQDKTMAKARAKDGPSLSRA